MSKVTRAEMLLGRVIGDVKRGLRDLTYNLEECDPAAITTVQGQLMRKAADLVGVLASALQGRSALEAMGAPGDWGYGDPIGDGLLAALRDEGQNPAAEEVPEPPKPEQYRCRCGKMWDMQTVLDEYESKAHPDGWEFRGRCGPGGHGYLIGCPECMDMEPPEPEEEEPSCAVCGQPLPDEIDAMRPLCENHDG